MLKHPAKLKEMLQAFLRAELDSPTESARLLVVLERLGLGKELILQDSSDTESLWHLFHEYRGLETLINGLDLAELDWYWIELAISDIELKTLTCINHFESDHGTRRPAVIAAAWERSKRENGVLNKVKKGERLEPPILVGDPGLEKMVILEGHNRVISYLRDPTLVKFPIPALVGTSPKVSQWCQW